MEKWLLIFVCLLPLRAYTQEDFQWWNEVNNWDGVTHWTSYIEKVPARMGVNALPVPGMFPPGSDDTFVRIDHRWHAMRGDLTRDLHLSLTVPLCSGSVFIVVQGVALEHYRMSARIRDQRHARDYDGRGMTVGDITIETFLYFFQGHQRIPDIVFRSALRTASGGKLGAARYTDAPGYYFDLMLKDRLAAHWQWVVTGGLYVWQADHRDPENLYRQDDAFLFGAGLMYQKSPWKSTANFSGYLGYLDVGDRPMGLEVSIERDFGGMYAGLWGRQGFKDNKYSSLGVFVRLPVSSSRKE